MVEVSPKRYCVELLADDGEVRLLRVHVARACGVAGCGALQCRCTRVRSRVRVWQPRVPSVEAVIEFLIGMTTGDVEKGGSRSARDKDWYASPMWGKSQAEMLMPEDKKGKYGWGAFKDLP